MDAVACRFHDPLLELFIGIGQRAECAQGNKAVFDVLDAGFNPAFLLGIAGRARRDDKPVAFGHLPIGALDFGIMVTGFGNSALGVVDDHLQGNAAEELEGPAVTGKPGGGLLIRYDLGIGVSTEAQGHNEDPGLGHDTGENILDIRPFAEVNLSCLSRFKLQNAGDGFLMISEFLRQTPHGGITAAKTELSLSTLFGLWSGRCRRQARF